METATPAISVLILTRNEAASLAVLLPELARQMAQGNRTYEVVVIDADSPDGTVAVALRHGARVIAQMGRGYASALREGFSACHGDYIVTLDADMSHRAEVVHALLAAAEDADLVVASRYICGGRADMRWDRRLFSLLLNRVFGTTLGLPVRDLSSGFRVYRREALATLAPQGKHFDILPELAALAYFSGLCVREIPFHYRQREAGVSKARVMRFAPAYIRTLLRCWRIKHSVCIAAAQ
ncbi:glycosyltransferase [Pseudolysobacter antarcticus]|uniref:Glycosyltransferase n=1 Tax=Pseudolysobacter antarcticus TaxID=2511995 RepID=A0A411HGY9_9GAMM|nr:glycosyltransferase [Pseudolysobacter antarcticus]QBB69690.1 glycosyltransferase [Pseudolysobacter antarcticus]